MKLKTRCCGWLLLGMWACQPTGSTTPVGKPKRVSRKPKFDAQDSTQNDRRGINKCFRPEDVKGRLAFEAERGWLKTEFPYEEFILDCEEKSLLPALLDWAKPGQTIDVFDRSCKQFSLTRRDGVFFGRLNERSKTDQKYKTFIYDEIIVDDLIAIAYGVERHE